MGPTQQLAALQAAMDVLPVEHAREVAFLRKENDILHERLRQAQLRPSSSSPPSSDYLAPHLRSQPTPRPPPRRDLPWDVIINVFQQCEDRSTLAVASRASFDLLELCSPLLYETVVLESVEEVEMLFCPSNTFRTTARLLPFLSLRQIHTLHFHISRFDEQPHFSHDRILPPHYFPTGQPPPRLAIPSLHLSFLVPEPVGRRSSAQVGLSHLFDLLSPSQVTFSYIGTYDHPDGHYDTYSWMPVAVGVMSARSMERRWTSLNKIVLDGCIPFVNGGSFVLSPEEDVAFWRVSGRDEVVVEFMMSKKREGNRDEHESLVWQLGHFGILDVEGLKKVIVRVPGEKEKGWLEGGRATDEEWRRVEIVVDASKAEARETPRLSFSREVLKLVAGRMEIRSLAVACRVSMGWLEVMGPELYATVDLKTSKKVQQLFCSRRPSNSRILPFISLDQISTLRLFTPSVPDYLSSLSTSRFLGSLDTFPLNLQLIYNLPGRPNHPLHDDHSFPIFASAHEAALSLCNPTHLSFSYIGPFTKGDTWMPLDIGITIGRTLRSSFTNVKTILLDRCIPFDLEDEMILFVLQASEKIRDVVVTFGLTSSKTTRTERVTIVDDLTRHAIMDMKGVKKVVVRVKGWKEIEQVEEGISRLDKKYLKGVPVEVVSLEGPKAVGGGGGGRGRGNKSRRARGGRGGRGGGRTEVECNALRF